MRRPSHVQTRRAFLRAAAVGGTVLAAGGLSSCASPLATSGGDTLLRFWNLFEGGEYPILQEMYAPFVRAHPDIDFRPVTLAWGQPYYTKLAMSSTGGRAPETAIAHVSRVNAYAAGGLLAPFDLDRMAQLDLRPDDFNSDLWTRGSVGDELYAVPLDTHPILAFYNTEVCGEVGLLDADNRLIGLDSPDRFLEAGRELAKATGGFGMSQGGVWRTFWTYFGQSGGTIKIPANHDPSALEFDTDIAVATLEYMAKVHDGTISPTVDGSDQYAMFVSRQSAILFGGTWSLATLRDTDIPIDAAPFPQIFEHPGAFADSHSFVLPFQRDVNEDSRQAAYEFIAHMIKDGLTWTTAGHLPAYTPIMESEEFRKMVPQSHYQDAGKHLFLGPHAWFSGAGTPYETRMEQIFQAALLGQSTPREAVDQTVRETRDLIESPSPL